MKRGMVLLMLVWALVACGRAEHGNRVVFVSSSEHHHLDPQRMSWAHDIRTAHLLYDPLVRLDYADQSIHPATAERWTISDDGLTYTFTLRDGAKWSSGEAVMPEDFIYAWRRALLPDLAADYTQMFFAIRGARAFYDWRTAALAEFTRNPGDGVALWEQTKAKFDEMVGVRAVDARTLEVTLERPTAYFLSLTAFPAFVPVHRASVEAVTRVNGTTGMVEVDAEYWSKPVSNGPYVLSERVFQERVTLDVNAHYWDRANVKNEGVVQLIVPDPLTAIQKYQRGEVDFLPDIPSAGPIAADLVKQAGTRPDVHVQHMAGTYFYNFNCLPTLPDGRSNPLADVRVRKALSLAMDRRAVVESVTRVNQPVARSFVPPGVVAGYEPPVERGTTFDVQRAKALLAEAGYPGGAGLTGLSILYNTGNFHELIAQAVQRQWKEHLGVEVALEALPSKAFSTRLKQHEFTIARAAWFGDYPDPTTWLGKMHSDDGNNDAQWRNARYDALLAEADALPPAQAAARLAKLAEAEALMLDEEPMGLVYHYVNVYLFDPAKLKGLELNGWARYRLEGVTVVR